MKALRRLLLSLVAILTLALVGFVAYATIATAEPQPEALAALERSALVDVQRDGWLVFRPRDVSPRTGLILYPGGLVDPRAYAPAAHQIAAAGYLVVIPPMPVNLAVFAANRAADVMSAFPEVAQWAVGGHSLGGAMAAQFTADNPERVAGLALWAAYPPGGADLSRQALVVVSVYGTRDGLSTLAEIEASRAQLPANTTFVEIEGGNHAQFGWYGTQKGDLPATLGHEAQQEQIVVTTIALLNTLAQ